jgi:uncharacterized protein YlzI (FlbEa/FlbD family)
MILLALLLAFTAPNGTPIHIEHSGIEVVRAADCAPGGRTEIHASTGTYCVQESVEEVLRRIEDANG